MIPQVADDVYRRVIEFADQDENPLDLHDPVVKADAAVEAVNQALDGMDAALAKRIAHSLRRLEAGRPRMIGNTQRLPDLDQVTAELLIHLDVDPLMVAWLSRLCQGVRVEDGDTLDEIIDVDGHLPPTDSMCDTTVRLDDDAMWKSTGTLIVHRLPDTVAAAAIGRPLREVVSHPVLDRHPLTIVAATPESTMASATLVTDIRHRLLGVDDLLAMGPCGSR